MGSPATLGRLGAQERMAAFRLDLAHRPGKPGDPAHAFRLGMTREKGIGSYLEMALETVSRTLSLFERQGLLHLSHRLNHIVDVPAFALRLPVSLQR